MRPCGVMRRARAGRAVSTHDGLVGVDVPDAEPAPLTTGRLVPPVHAAVWIRLAGGWHRGEIEYWFRAYRGIGGWCVAVHCGGVRQSYRYDAERIVRRDTETPPS